MATATTPCHHRSAIADPAKPLRRTPARSRPASENRNPNVLPISSSPSPMKVPTSSSKSKKALHRSPVPPPPPPERRFIVVKRNSKKGPEGTLEDRRRAAYDSLRASQDGFFAKETVPAPVSPPKEASVGEELVEGGVSPELVEEAKGSMKVRKMRSKVMEEAMNSLPEQGCGRVLHLVKAFESILSLSRSGEGRGNAGSWALPGMRPPPPRAAVSCSLSGELLGSQGGSRLCSSLDGSVQSLRLSFDRATTGGGRRSRRNSSDSVGSRHKNLGVTHQRPFKLRTEQRGRLKEEQFLNKVKEMLMEQEKRRIPQAQGLPWTTDEPECLVKPVVKEPTEPADIVLHSDVRAVERAEFDNYVAERMVLAEQKRLERERQQQLEEEEETRRMRKELVPKAQPMPYFDRPFVPKKSERPQTIPREPRFHRVQSHKQCVAALTGITKQSRITSSYRS